MRLELNYRLHAFKSGHAEMRRSGNHITYVFERDTCMTAQFWAERSSGEFTCIFFVVGGGEGRHSAYAVKPQKSKSNLHFRDSNRTPDKTVCLFEKDFSMNVVWGSNGCY